MTRAIVAVMLMGGLLVSVSAPGCADQGVGDPCTPEQEFDQSFLGFDEKEVNVESKSFQCRTRLCLVNHFRGRVSCPYGQSSDGVPPTGTPAPNDSGCTIPGSTSKVTGADDQGNFSDPRKKATVPAQCSDRKASQAVYCSCRCANTEGRDDDGANYCKCPDGFVCAQLVTSIGQGNEGLTGGYCIKERTEYDATLGCQQGDCDPAARKCD
jgi:hypothetical protein